MEIDQFWTTTFKWYGLIAWQWPRLSQKQSGHAGSITALSYPTQGRCWKLSSLMEPSIGLHQVCVGIVLAREDSRIYEKTRGQIILRYIGRAFYNPSFDIRWWFQFPTSFFSIVSFYVWRFRKFGMLLENTWGSALRSNRGLQRNE